MAPELRGSFELLVAAAAGGAASGLDCEFSEERAGFWETDGARSEDGLGGAVFQAAAGGSEQETNTPPEVQVKLQAHTLDFQGFTLRQPVKILTFAAPWQNLDGQPDPR